MKINLLVKRESFLEIFQKSTTDFLQEKYSDSSFTDIKYIVNDYLNIVYPVDIKRNELVNLVSEFKYHSSFYRRTLQTIYSFLAIRRPMEIIASSKSIFISMPINLKGWVFIPGNHSIRVVDLINNKCFVFLKAGFNIKFIDHFDRKIAKINIFRAFESLKNIDYGAFFYGFL